MADTIIRTVELGVAITDAALDGDMTVVFADLLVDGPGRCPGCGVVGVYRDRVERRVSDVPVAGYPLLLRVRVPRYRCVYDGCARGIFVHDSSRLARPGASTTRRCAGYVVRRLAIDKATVAAVARELGRSWDTVNAVAVAATEQLLLCAGPVRLDGVRVIGVDEHRWAHVFGAEGDGFVTVITDLTAVVAGQGRARLLDLVPGRSAEALKTWLEARDQGFRARVEVVAMDGFGGYKNAATAAVPDAVTVMDPFHVVALAGHKLDLCRQRVQQDTCGHRGRSGDPLYRVRRTLRTRLGLLTGTHAVIRSCGVPLPADGSVISSGWIGCRLAGSATSLPRRHHSVDVTGSARERSSSGGLAVTAKAGPARPTRGCLRPRVSRRRSRAGSRGEPG
ncbi:ISL3 family transposase [Pseudonocardia phyllosphaerae]|uniref:ISL3 family transposase n=1 Tax=Pseudonocardia phyllosphaerae TaxID=3390502 RepID=UPI00397D6396